MPVPSLVYPCAGRAFFGLAGLGFFGKVFCLLGLFVFLQVFVGEFDPGSGRTLAACLTHASRAERPFLGTRAANG
jgi:hypothetical protein